MKVMKPKQAIQIGFSADKRQRRRQHPRAALNLMRQGGFFNAWSARGSSFGQVALWHLGQARAL